MAVFHREMEFLASHSDALGEFLNAEEKVLNSQMSVGELVTATMQAYLKKAPSLIAHPFVSPAANQRFVAPAPRRFCLPGRWSRTGFCCFCMCFFKWVYVAMG